MSYFAEVTKRLNDSGVEVSEPSVRQVLQGTVKTSAHWDKIFAVALSVTREHLTDHVDRLEDMYLRGIEHGTPRRGGRQTTRERI